MIPAEIVVAVLILYLLFQIGKAYLRKDALKDELKAAQARIEVLEDSEKKLKADVELAWGVIANVSGSDWTKQSKEWQLAAKRWQQRAGY